MPLLDKKIRVAAYMLSADEILHDYRLVYQSRQASLIGRREVMSGRAKFGVFGDGKELPQIALAKVFRKGDWRSGYYRDQTLMLALSVITLQEFFAQLYAHTDVQAEPMSGGRQMNAHFASRSLNPDGSWRNLSELYNTAADLSPTGSQMPHLVGLAQASKIYREVEDLQHLTQFSRHGDEVAFGTIGNASTAEGMFWESINAIGVLQVPAVLSIWDDGYGISVANEHQMVKQNLTDLLKGFQRTANQRDGFDIYRISAWDYSSLLDAYSRASETARRDHVPAILHVVDVTQPQGHSTGGSHERYKSKERLDWEKEYDCLRKFRQWISAEGIATDNQLDAIEREEKELVENNRKAAWEAYTRPIREEMQEVCEILDEMALRSLHADALSEIKASLLSVQTPLRREIMVGVREALFALKDEDTPGKQVLIGWKQKLEPLQIDRYDSHLYSQSKESALNVPEVKSSYSPNSPLVYGSEVLKAGFDRMFQRDPRVIAFGEDIGRMGDVYHGFEGIQAKYGERRVSDTGIRETTIVAQAIGLALRGLRPIAEIQYLDYLLYALQILSDDLATLHWRTRGGQKAPVIIRTRGHRFEGVWHSGSLMAGVMHLLRGVHVLVPRNMTQATGFYNTLLQSDEPGLVVEVIHRYRVKERLPDNVGEFTVPIGVPEIVREGSGITLVTYGETCHIVMEAADLLRRSGVEAEVIDVQSLLPFDIHGRIVESLKKTSRILFIDEDVPGGTTAYMMQEVLEKQGGQYWLDSPARTLPGKPHRPAYGSDGDYWSKPNVETVFETAYEMMYEAEPAKYPMFYR
jgi:pyruvate/2-oxoglutarate/acetoin dehydrogenase E1 component/TPP-dependent pyruvate/acetoin dehydrogenase alpha subunit